MAGKQKSPSKEEISRAELEQFIAETTSRVLPERVAEMIGSRLLAPHYDRSRPDPLPPLIDDLRRRLGERNLVPPIDGTRTLSKKERRMVTAIVTLLRRLVDSALKSGRVEGIIASIEETRAWAGVVDDTETIAILLDIEGAIYAQKQEYERALSRHRQSEQLGRTAIAQDEEGIEMLRRSLYHQANIATTTGRHGDAIRLLRELIDLPFEGEYLTLLSGLFHNRLAENYIALSAWDLAEEAVAKGVAAVESVDPEHVHGLLGSRFELLMARGELADALAAVRHSLEIAQANGDDDRRASGLVALARVHRALDEPSGAADALLEAIEIFGRQQQESQRIGALLRLADVRSELGATDESLATYREVLDLTTEPSLRPLRASALGKIGDLYERLDRLADAEASMREELSVREEMTPTEHGIPSTMIRLARLLVQDSRRTEARRLLEEAVERLETHEQYDRADLVAAYDLLASIAEESRKLKQANEYLRRARRVERELIETTHQTRLADLRVVHEVEQERNRAELERLRRLELESEVEQHTIELVQKGELISNVSRKMREILGDLESEQIPQVNSALRQILRHVGDVREQQGRPILLLRSVDDSFYDDLRRLHPDLTTGQVKLCGLIRSGMDREEIATILNITPRSLNTLRYRLRKKLGVAKEESLEGVIQGVGGGG